MISTAAPKQQTARNWLCCGLLVWLLSPPKKKAQVPLAAAARNVVRPSEIDHHSTKRQHSSGGAERGSTGNVYDCPRDVPCCAWWAPPPPTAQHRRCRRRQR